MTYRGHVKNGAIVLDPPVKLPEGAAVELNVLPAAAHNRPAITSLEQLRGEYGDGDALGDDFLETIRAWRNEPWRSTAGDEEAASGASR